MKKIRNIHDLRQERELLEQRKFQLEKELHRDWNDLKQNITGHDASFLGLMRNKHTSGLVSKAISLGTGMLVSKFGGKIGSKIYSWFK